MYDDNGETTKTKHQVKSERRKYDEAKQKTLLSEMPTAERRNIEAISQKGASSWLTSLPLKDQGYDLSKQEFWDACRLRYNWALERTPSQCACGSSFDTSHGFVTLRHNELRDITAELLNEVCKDVKKEPPLVELNGEVLQKRSANTSREARLDIRAANFWIQGQRAFFDVRVFDYRGLDLAKCYERNEKEKKRHYGERILQVENGSFTPLVFSTNGGMGRECSTFFKRLSEMIAEKRKLPVSTNVVFLGTIYDSVHTRVEVVKARCHDY